MPKFTLARSKHINASPEKVFNIVNDFNTWTVWSPWLLMEPEAKVEVAADGKSYSWNGKRTGSGNMKILIENPNHSLDVDLNFHKPWKSHAKVYFKIREENNGSFAIYHKWKFVKRECTYTSAVPIDIVPENLPSEFKSGFIPETKVYVLEHVGPYEHLGNGWSTMSNVVRGKEIKVRKDISPFETYKNDPNTTIPHELVTHINFAVK